MNNYCQEQPSSSLPENLPPIRDIAQQNEVPPATLRAWERCLGSLQPQRTAQGHGL